MVVYCPACGQPTENDGWRFEPESGSLCIDDRRIDLTPSHAAILGTLLRSPLRCVPARDLLRALETCRGYGFVVIIKPKINQ